MVTIWQTIKGIIYFFIGIILAWILPIKVGGLILDIFSEMVGSTNGLVMIFSIVRWIIIIVLAILAPIIFLTNSKIEDKILKQFGG